MAGFAARPFETFSSGETKSVAPLMEQRCRGGECIRKTWIGAFDCHFGAGLVIARPSFSNGATASSVRAAAAR
jgi:hypothetical protein